MPDTGGRPARVRVEFSLQPLALHPDDAAQMLGLSRRQLDAYNKAKRVRTNAAGAYPLRELQRFEAELEKGLELGDDGNEIRQTLSVVGANQGSEDLVLFEAQPRGRERQKGRSDRGEPIAPYPKLP